MLFERLLLVEEEDFLNLVSGMVAGSIYCWRFLFALLGRLWCCCCYLVRLEKSLESIIMEVLDTEEVDDEEDNYV